MRIILLTQDDPFYLAETTADFIDKIGLQGKHSIITCIVSAPSPFGKKETSSKKIRKTLEIFGLKFFFFYSMKFIYRRIIIRKSVIKEIRKRKIDLWLLNGSINSKSNTDKLRSLEPDVIIIIAGNQIIKKDVLKIPKYGAINAHSSLLPKHKGLMPTFWALKSGDKETGVTVYKLTEGIDDGPIINFAEIPIDSQMTQSDLVIKSKYLANNLLIDAIELIVDERNFRKNEGGNYNQFPTRDDVKTFYKNKRKFF